MELSKNFEPAAIDAKWYQHCLEKGYFNSVPDGREPYTVVIPPPNVTGVLHMGHCLNNTIQDILIRRARMQGKNACWVPGTDHASIATEAKVVAMLRERGIAKSSLSREEFLNYAWEWKEKYGGIILQQLKKLGCSLDWNRTSFTMDDDYYKSVISVFIDLYKKGLIYRGKRMINWDTKAKTALSDEEVIRKETSQKLYHLKYPIEGSTESITIATVRPETIMGDTAICVHPNDERYKHLHGKYALVPLINRRIPIITDDYVTMEFGTGALKVTPAHDMNDYQLGQKHNLEVVDILNDDGTLSEAAQIFIGVDRFEARKKIVTELEAKGHLIRTEDYTSEVGYSERTDTVVEPRLSLQWWVSMKKISEPALKAVMDDEIKFHPVKFKNLYRHWMENVKDWCISRQLWWGHRIPAWYDAEGRFVVASNETEAYDKFYEQYGSDKVELKQDEDCLDTWFSSWLWPFEVFKGYSNPGNADVKYYYPTSTLVTAPEIIFFWVARMIIAGYEYMGGKPFSDVYFTGIVRDKIGRKMSKSLGNSPDLLALIDQYGADAVRFGIMVSSPAGNDLMFDENSLDQGRNFNNKLWNALKLLKIWEVNATGREENQTDHYAVAWMENRIYRASAEIDSLLNQFRLSEALKMIYSLIWDDFCSYYLEKVKPEFQQPIELGLYKKTVEIFTNLMQILHPFMPFITEEIYHKLQEREDDLACKKIDQFKIVAVDEQGIALTELCKKFSSKLAEFRTKKGIKKDKQIKFTLADNPFSPNELNTRLKKDNAVTSADFKMSGFTDVETSSAEIIFHGDFIIIDKYKFFIDLSDIHRTMEKAVLENQKSQRKAELEKDLEYQKNFLASVEKKLSNEKFVQNARPEVIELEKKKKADAEARIRTIEESLSTIS